jgi:hypothetical protein
MNKLLFLGETFSTSWINLYFLAKPLDSMGKFLSLGKTLMSSWLTF